MIPKIPFGRTGHLSTRTIFGGWAFHHVTPEEADRTLDTLLQYGVNHIDTAAMYGVSEERIGVWMDRHRDKFFLATKVSVLTYDEAWESINNSLKKLRVDHVDLLQLHMMDIEDETWDTMMGKNGALKAIAEARDQGLTRFLGVTGHGLRAPGMHKRSLEQFNFDSVLCPCNFLLLKNTKYRADFEALVGLAKERNVGIQTIKSIAQRWWDDQPDTVNTGYIPLEEQTDIDRAVHWLFGHEALFLNTCGDINYMPRVVDAASRFTAAPSDDDMQKMVDRLGMQPLW